MYSQSGLHEMEDPNNLNDSKKDSTPSWVNRSKEYLAKMKKWYIEVEEEISGELRTECLSLSVIYAKKFILRIIITLGSSFLIQVFMKSIKISILIKLARHTAFGK